MDVFFRCSKRETYWLCHLENKCEGDSSSIRRYFLFPICEPSITSFDEKSQQKIFEDQVKRFRFINVNIQQTIVEFHNSEVDHDFYLKKNYTTCWVSPWVDAKKS